MHIVHILLTSSLLWFLQSSKSHLGSRNVLFGVLQIVKQSLIIPYNTLVDVGGSIRVSCGLSGLAADHAIEIGSNLVWATLKYRVSDWIYQVHHIIPFQQCDIEHNESGRAWRPLRHHLVELQTFQEFFNFRLRSIERDSFSTAFLNRVDSLIFN